MEDAMKEEKTVDRREFTLAAALAALSGVVITISASACGGGSSPSSPSTPAPTPSPGGGGTATDKTGVIGSNHGHGNSTITAAQLTAGGAVTLNIQGGASHPHTVELTQADIASIAANQRVSKESSSDNGHSHSVTFN
jgi:hypothetical protein